MHVEALGTACLHVESLGTPCLHVEALGTACLCVHVESLGIACLHVHVEALGTLNEELAILPGWTNQLASKIHFLCLPCTGMTGDCPTCQNILCGFWDLNSSLTLGWLLLRYHPSPFPPLPPPDLPPPLLPLPSLCVTVFLTGLELDKNDMLAGRQALGPSPSVWPPRC